jgi:hypothetical protein
MPGRGLSRRSRRRLGLAAGLLALGTAGSVGVLVATPAAAEASTSVATLTLTGVVDSNCVISTGGTTVYIAPKGTVDFKAALGGISVKVLGQSIPLDTAHVASFIDTLVIDNDSAHPHQVTGTANYKFGAGTGNHSFTWTATSVQLLPIPILAPSGITVPLSSANTVLAAGAKLTWNATISNSQSNTCGLSGQLPGVQASAGPVAVSIPPVALPSVTVPSSVTGVLPGGAGGPGPATGQSTSSSGNPYSYSDPGEQVPAAVVPKGGDGGLHGAGSPTGASSGGGGGADGKNAARVGGASSLTSGDATRADSADLSSKHSPSAQIPVVLAVLAILALSVASAAYARVYLIRRSTS